MSWILDEKREEKRRDEIEKVMVEKRDLEIFATQANIHKLASKSDSSDLRKAPENKNDKNER